MTNRRFRSYKRALALLSASEFGSPDNTDEIAILREQAQDLLLTRDADVDEADDLEHHAAIALSRLVADGAITGAVAFELWRHIKACGPEEATPSPVAAAPQVIR